MADVAITPTVTPAAGFTVTDLDKQFPNLVLRELHDGVLIVRGSPKRRHQRIAGRMFLLLQEWTEEHGGEVFFAPLDMVAASNRLYQPDLMLVPESPTPDEENYVDEPPSPAVEVLSPSTRWLDLGLKVEAYATFGIPEYWIVDPRDHVVLVHVLIDKVYGEPTRLVPGDVLTAERLPGLAIDVRALLA